MDPLRRQNEYVRLYRPPRKPLAKAPRFLKFAACGAAGALIQLAVLDVCFRTFHLPITGAYPIAFGVSATFTFLANSLWTFSGKRSHLGNYGLYIATMAVTFLIGEGLMYELVSVWGVNHLLANAGVIALIFPINYHISRKIVWNRSKPNEQRSFY